MALENCPVCGGSAKLNEAYGVYSYSCCNENDHLAINLGIHWYETQQEAELMWNRAAQATKEMGSCPFCGKNAYINKDTRYPRPKRKCVNAFEPVCVNMDCLIYMADNKYFLTPEEARDKWNDRKYLKKITPRILTVGQKVTSDQILEILRNEMRLTHEHTNKLPELRSAD